MVSRPVPGVPRAAVPGVEAAAAVPASQPEAAAVPVVRQEAAVELVAQREAAAEPAVQREAAAEPVVRQEAVEPVVQQEPVVRRAEAPAAQPEASAAQQQAAAVETDARRAVAVASDEPWRVAARLASLNSETVTRPALVLVRALAAILRRSAECPALPVRRTPAAAADRWLPATPIPAAWLNSESVPALATILRRSAERPVLSLRQAPVAAVDRWLPAMPILAWWLNSESVLRAPGLIPAMPAVLRPALSARQGQAAGRSLRAALVRAASQPRQAPYSGQASMSVRPASQAERSARIAPVPPERASWV
jgi:hypothetical protein